MLLRLRLLLAFLVVAVAQGAARTGALLPASSSALADRVAARHAKAVTPRDSSVGRSGSSGSMQTALVAASVLRQRGADRLEAILSKYGGAACIAGGILSHIVFGTLYCWSNFQSYSPPSLRFFDGLDHKGSSPDAMLVFPLTLVAQCFAMPFGTIVAKQLGPRAAMLLGCTIVSVGVLLASYATTLSAFIFFYSIVFGTGVGLGYTAAMIAGWKWMPNSKGLVSGSILAGFGSGGFFFNLIGTKLVNPNGLNPVKGVFPQEVYDNFPKMLRTLACIYMTMGLFGALFISEPPVPTGDLESSSSISSSKRKDSSSSSSSLLPTSSPSGGAGTAVAAELPGVSVQDALRTPQFWLIWTMIVSSASAGLNVASVYKQFASASPALHGDSFQALVGGLGALSNGVGRIFWGTLCDKIGFKQSFALLTLIQALVHAYYPSTANSKSAFAFFTCLCYFFLAGNFALMPPSIQRLFGPRNGSLIYGIVYSAFGTASIAALFMNKSLTASLGFEGVFRILSVFSIVATVLASQLTPVKAFAGSSL